MIKMKWLTYVSRFLLSKVNVILMTYRFYLRKYFKPFYNTHLLLPKEKQ